MFKRYGVYAAAIVIFIALYTLTKPATVGDAVVYVADVLAYSDGSAPGALWEFGHVLWRPLGWLSWQVTKPVTAGWYGGDARSEIMAGFVLINILGGIGIAIVTVAVCRALKVSDIRTLFVTTFLLSTNVLLNWTRAGTAYVAGFFCQLLAVYLLLRAVRDRSRSLRLSVIAGVALGVAVIMWFPYVLTTAGIVLLACLYDRDEFADSDGLQGRVRMAAVCAATAGAVVLGTYASVAVVHGFTTPDKFLAWIRSSSHGMNQNRRLLRVITGFPRGFIDFGNDGMILKRFLLHDPYAPVSLLDLIRLSLWKLPVFYGGFAALMWALFRSRERWGILVPFIAALIPMLFFAVALFEPSSVERFLPLFGILTVGFAIAARDFSIREHWQKLLIGCAVVTMAVNVYAFTGEQDPVSSPVAKRIALIHDKLRPHSRVVLLSTLDDIGTFVSEYPFHEFVRRNRLPVYHLMEPGIQVGSGTFPEFARTATETWNQGGEVWVSRRLLASRPLPEWNWVEGDNPALRWADISSYFQKFEIADSIGDQDGFVRLSDSLANRGIVSESLQSATARR